MREAPQTNHLVHPPKIPRPATTPRNPRPRTNPDVNNKAGEGEEEEEQEDEAEVLQETPPATTARAPRDLPEADPEARTGGDQNPPVSQVKTN